MGQYPFAALVGKVIDRFGPWSCSLVAAVLLSSGFGLFSLEIAKAPDNITQPSSTSFHNLTFFFFLAGKYIFVFRIGGTSEYKKQTKRRYKGAGEKRVTFHILIYFAIVCNFA